MKTCKRCGTARDESDYYGKDTRRRAVCKPCVRAERKYTGITCPGCGGKKDGTARLCERCREMTRSHGDEELRAAPAREWLMKAVCGDADVGLFYGGQETQIDALAVCFSCPVRAECGAHAIEQKEEHGIWGALTPGDREKVAANPAMLSTLLRKNEQRVMAAQSDERFCRACETRKPLSDFYGHKSSTMKTKVQSICKPCSNKRTQENYRKRQAAV